MPRFPLAFCQHKMLVAVIEGRIRGHAYSHIYSDENGETHFRDIDIEMSEVGPDGTTSKRLPATGVYFRTTPADWFFDWHPATRRQYVINLDAPNKITASDGETRIIGVGEILLIEDVHGKGHLSQAVGQMRRSVMIPID